METVNTLVLPGLDGTDRLLDRFQQYAPPTHCVTVLTLPDEPSLGYAQLCDHFTETVRSIQHCTLIGESFSGPLAVLLAHRHPNIVRHLVLVASFATPPTPPISRLIPWTFVFRLPLPTFVARRFLIGPNRDLIATLRNAVRLQSPLTLAHRIRLVSNVDVTSELRELQCPITYLRPSGDSLVSQHHMNLLSQLNDRVTIRQIDGPHLILQAQPQIAWQHIVETAPAALSR